MTYATYTSWTGTAPRPDTDPAGVRASLLGLLETEGPVQQGVIAKRYLHAANVPEGPAALPLRRALLDVLEELEEDGDIVSVHERAGESFCRVYRTAAQPTARLRTRGPRTPFEVPLSELAAAWDAEQAANPADEQTLVERVNSGFGFAYLVDNARTRILDAGTRMTRAASAAAGAEDAGLPSAARYMTMADVLRPASGEVSASPAEPAPNTSGGAAISESVPQPGDRQVLRQLLIDHLDVLGLGIRLPDELGDWVEYAAGEGLQLRIRGGVHATRVVAWIDHGPGASEENRAAAHELAAVLERLELPPGASIEMAASPVYRGVGVELVLRDTADTSTGGPAVDLRAEHAVRDATPFLDAVRAWWSARDPRSAEDADLRPEVATALPPEVAVIHEFVEEARGLGPRALTDSLLTTLAMVLRPVINVRFDQSSTDPSAQLAVLRVAAKRGDLDDLSQDERSAIFALTRARNAWAHNEQINYLDVMRAADAACTLVKAMAPEDVAAFQLLRFGVSAAQVWGNAAQIAGQRAAASKA